MQCLDVSKSADSGMLKVLTIVLIKNVLIVNEY